MVDIHQSIEPAHPTYNALIDFEIEDACVVIKKFNQGHLSHQLIDQVRELFDFVYERGDFLFCMSRNLHFNDARLEQIVQKLDVILY